MASPQKENGNTGIANELFEKFLLYDFPSIGTIKVWLFIARKTYGYQKKTDILSLSQIQLGTHLSRPTITDSLKWLVKQCLLVKGQETIKGNVYGLNKDYEQWVVNRCLLVKHRPLASKPVFTHNINNNKKNITPNGDKPMKPFTEPTIELDENGETKVAPVSKKTTFGKYPASIAVYYCTLVGKSFAGRQLPAAKTLLQIYQDEFPDDNLEEALKEIKARIDIAFNYYKSKKVNDWNLSKVAENWDKILNEWKGFKTNSDLYE